MAEFLEEDCSAYLGRELKLHAPNSEYAPISEMRLITRDYGNFPSLDGTHNYYLI